MGTNNYREQLRKLHSMFEAQPNILILTPEQREYIATIMTQFQEVIDQKSIGKVPFELEQLKTVASMVLSAIGVESSVNLNSAIQGLNITNTEPEEARVTSTDQARWVLRFPGEKQVLNDLIFFHDGKEWHVYCVSRSTSEPSPHKGGLTT